MNFPNGVVVTPRQNAAPWPRSTGFPGSPAPWPPKGAAADGPNAAVTSPAAIAKNPAFDVASNTAAPGRGLAPAASSHPASAEPGRHGLTLASWVTFG